MAKFLALRRIVRGGGVILYGGDTLTLEPDAKETQILLGRGYIIPVPDDYGKKPAAAGAAAEPSPTPPSGEPVAPPAETPPEAPVLTSAQKKILKARPQAEELAAKMNESLVTILGLSDEIYEAGIESYLNLPAPSSE